MKKFLYLIFILFFGCKTTVNPTWITEYHKNRVNDFAQDNNTYKVLFMGDSITEGGSFENIIPNSKNAAVGGDYIHCVKFVIPYVIKYNPEKIYLMIGINSLRDFTFEECKSQYKELIEIMLESFPDVEIVLESVLPISIKNQSIVYFNEYIKQLSCEYNLIYLDLYKYYAFNNVLPAELTIDGLHLSPNGYKIWYQVLKENKE